MSMTVLKQPLGFPQIQDLLRTIRFLMYVLKHLLHETSSLQVYPNVRGRKGVAAPFSTSPEW